MTVRGYQGVDCKPCSTEFSDYKRIRADAPVKGESRLHVGTYLKPGLYFFGSDIIMEGPEGFAPDGELRRVLRNRNGYVYLDEPWKRTWHGPAVIPLGVPILEDVQLIGGKGPIHVGLADRVTIRDWEVSSYTEARAISVQSCRNVQIQNVSVSNPSQTGPGQGYGVQIQRCTSFEARGVVGEGGRHATTCFASAGGSFVRCRAVKPKADGIDFAHFAVEDVDYYECDSGDTNGAVGNKWPWKSSVTIRDHQNCRDLLVYGNAEAEVVGGQFTGALRFHANEAGKQMRAEVTEWPFAKGFKAENGAEWELVASGPVSSINVSP